MLEKRSSEPVGQLDKSAWTAASGPWIAATRVLVGLLLLYEIAYGGWWKLNSDWIGLGAGGPLADRASRAVSEGTYVWYATILETVVIPHAWFWSNLALVMQLSFALALLVGFWTRPAAIAGLVYFLPVFNMGTIRTSPTFAVAIGFLVVTNAGYYYGLDGWIRTQSAGWANWSDRIATVGSIPREWYPGLAAGAALVGLYYLLTIPDRGYAFADGLALVGVELALLGAIVAGGFLLAYQGGTPTAIAADGLRVFVGYRLLHEIFVRVDPGVNTLPGWAPLAQQEALFTDIAATHIAPVSLFIEAVVVPALPAWVVAFALVQTVAGAALFVGYRTRLFGSVAVGYLLVLIGLGFVRLAPLLLMSAIAAASLGGRHASLDRIAGRSNSPASVPVPQQIASRLPTQMTVAAVGIGIIVAGLMVGVEPGGYGETTGAISLVMVGIAGVVFAVGMRGAALTPSTASSSD